MLEQVKTQLRWVPSTSTTVEADRTPHRDHVERHQLIRPPPSDEMGEELYVTCLAVDLDLILTSNPAEPATALSEPLASSQTCARSRHQRIDRREGSSAAVSGSTLSCPSLSLTSPPVSALAQARARRAALQSETEKLRAEPALPSIAQEAVDEAREELVSLCGSFGLG